MWTSRRTPAVFIASIRRATRSTWTAWNVCSPCSRLMPARLTTASQPRRAAGSMRLASQPVRRERMRTVHPASWSAADTWRPRKPLPPTTAISAMPQIYEHVHINASLIRHGKPGGDGGLEDGPLGGPLERAPEDAEEDGAEREEPEQRAVDRARRDFLGVLVAALGQIHRGDDPQVVEERDDREDQRDQHQGDAEAVIRLDPVFDHAREHEELGGEAGGRRQPRQREEENRHHRPQLRRAPAHAPAAVDGLDSVLLLQDEHAEERAEVHDHVDD